MHVTAIVLLLSAALAAEVTEPFDLKLDRSITQEPTYEAKQPLYGLVLIGRAPPLKVWMVLDKSQVDAKDYDVLYVDLNGDGKLTGEAERFTAATDQPGGITFQLPEVTDPSSGSTHTEFQLKVSHREPATHMVSLFWQGKHKIGGGYPEKPDLGYMRFAVLPDNAPVIWINGDGPFRFQRWYSGEFGIGEQGDLKVFLGLPGAGSGSFCAFQRHVLPDGELVLATLIYTDTDGKQRERTFELNKRC